MPKFIPYWPSLGQFPGGRKSAMGDFESLMSFLFKVPKNTRLFMSAAVGCCLFLSLMCGVLAAQVQSTASNALIEKLRKGGYNLYIRHAATDWSQSDKIRQYGDWESCDPAKVRQLSQQGRHDARELGIAFRSLRIRLGRVFASPYCRTMDTARLISERDPIPTTDLMNLRAQEFVGGRDVIVARARRRLSQSPMPGVNDLFVAHGNLGRAAVGVSLGEGQVAVVAPRGDGRFDVLGTLDAATLSNMLHR